LDADSEGRGVGPGRRIAVLAVDDTRIEHEGRARLLASKGHCAQQSKQDRSAKHGVRLLYRCRASK
jgi:hypothetical protein